MEDATITLILLLGPSLTHACTLLSVTQNPPVLVAVTGQEVNIRCDVKLKAGIEKMFSTLFRAEKPSELLGNVSATAQNATVICPLKVTEGSGLYYCRVTCGKSSSDGQGTYIHVRDSGFVAPSSASFRLCSGLIALCILLLLLAVSGTYLVLPWKTEDKSSPTTGRVTPAEAEPPRSRATVEDAGGSLYTSLEPRTEEVYDVLEDEAKEPPKKHQVEIHEVASRSPGKRPQLQAKVSSILEKPPIKPKHNKNVSENNVYENLSL